MEGEFRDIILPDVLSSTVLSVAALFFGSSISMMSKPSSQSGLGWSDDGGQCVDCSFFSSFACSFLFFSISKSLRCRATWLITC